jgi:sulfite exporter TauE/SafE
MCGPLAAALPLPGSRQNSLLLGSFLYNLGRAMTYALLGILTGLFGQSLALWINPQLLSILFGSLIILWALGQWLGVQLPKSSLIEKPLKNLRKHMAQWFQQKSFRGVFAIGLLNGLLPCGLVYMALAASIGLGTWYGGSLFMLLFGLSTFPALMAVNLLPKLMGKKVNLGFQKWAPALALVVGMLLVVRGLNLGIPYVSPKMVVEEQTNAQGEAIPQARMECHTPAE